VIQPTTKSTSLWTQLSTEAQLKIRPSENYHVFKSKVITSPKRFLEFQKRVSVNSRILMDTIKVNNESMQTMIKADPRYQTMEPQDLPLAEDFQ
jgi:hypothetical protein